MAKPNYSIFSETTIKKIIIVLDRIKDAFDLRKKANLIYWGNEDSYTEADLNLPVLEIEMDLEEFGVPVKDIHPIIEILLKEKFLFSFGKKGNCCTLASSDSWDNFNKKYKNIKEKFQNLGKPKIWGHPSFSENPPTITWGDFKIKIPVNSKQLVACRIMFRKSIGELVSWDEIAEEIDGSENGEIITKPRTIYDAVKIVNEKVENKTKQKLFELHKTSFSRLY